MSITEFVKEFLTLYNRRELLTLNAWHSAHSDKHFVQLNQTASAEEQSDQVIISNIVFNVAEWVTIMKYEAIAEQEVAVNQVTSIREFIFAL
jgi:hypothetical protein